MTLKSFWAALGFLTIVPVPRSTPRGNTMQILFFPVVGVLIGALAGGVHWIGAHFLYPEIQPLLVVLFLALITGGLHLDGLADTADALLSHRNREGMLTIMRDPRIGPMGTLTLFFCLAFKVAAVASLSGNQTWIWLMTACGLARTAQVMGLVFSDYARQEGGPLEFFFQKGRYSLLSLASIPLLAPLALGGIQALSVWALFGGITLFWIGYMKFKIGGMTGDTLGALSEILETALLLLAGWWTTHG